MKANTELFLAFASFMGFTVYQMDVKSAFLYGNITEEVYVKQPPGFEDPAHPNKVYRVVKALYGLHQAPRAWYERLSTFLLKHGYRRGAIDKTLFIKKDRRDIMLVQISSTPKFSPGMLFNILEEGCLLAMQKQTIVAISSTEQNKVAATSLLVARIDKFALEFDPISLVLASTIWLQLSARDLTKCHHIRATVAGKKVLISEETIRADLLFDDADGVDCFPKQVIWDSLRDIGYEGNLAQLTFSKPLFSPQWKYLVHVLLHCLSPKSTSWEQFGTNIASALVGLATNQKFNFSLMILNGMLGHISNGTPFLMITPLTPPMLEVVTALAAEEAHSTSSHSRAETSPRDAQGTPIQSAAQTSISTAEGTVDLQDTAEAQGTDECLKNASQKNTSRGDEWTFGSLCLKQPVVKHHAFWVESQDLKKRRKKQRKKVSSVKLGRNKDEGTLSEEHYVQEDYTARSFIEEIVDKDAVFIAIKVRYSKDAYILMKKQVLQVQFRSNSEERVLKNSSKLMNVLAESHSVSSRPMRFKHSGPYNSHPQQPTQATDPKDKAKGYCWLERFNAEWDGIRRKKKLEELKKAKPKTILKKPTSLAQERNQMMNFLKGQGYKNLQKLRYPQMKELYDKVQESIKDSFKDFIPMGSEKEKQLLQERDAKRLLRKRKATISEEQPSKKLKESLEAISVITEFKVIDSPDGEYLIIFRANNHFRAFNTLWEILHILDRQDLYHLYRVVQDYYEHIPPTGLGLVLLGDLTTIWETPETSDDDFWKNQEDWEIIRWRLNESSGVHTLELEDGTMIHMLAERRYPLSRELMIRMLDHGMEVINTHGIALAVLATPKQIGFVKITQIR
ncbi:putative ribonuclease H-like domain-containing protein [Tanacetum coccineum]